jgi:hypothetical protein
MYSDSICKLLNGNDEKESRFTVHVSFTKKYTHMCTIGCIDLDFFSKRNPLSPKKGKQKNNNHRLTNKVKASMNLTEQQQQPRQGHRQRPLLHIRHRCRHCTFEIAYENMCEEEEEEKDGEVVMLMGRLEALSAYPQSYGTPCARARERLLSLLRDFDWTDVFNLFPGDNTVLSNVFARAASNDSEVFVALVERGIKLELRDRFGFTAIYYALLSNSTERVRLLLDRGVDLESCTIANGCSSLAIAAGTGRIAMMQLLLDYDEDCDKLSYGWTPLMYASSWGEIDAVKFLLDLGADKDFVAGATTAADLADTEEIRKLIVEHVCTNYVLK